MITNFKLGADPELFLIDLNTNKYQSAEGIIGGNKDEPIVISKEGFALQEDNVMVEFNIPPAHTKEEFSDNINFMLSYINTVIPNNLVTAIEPSVEMPWNQLETTQALTFGCSPDFNAWTGEQNSSPDAELTNVRSAGGHLHIGYDNPSEEKSARLIKCLDLFVGLPLAFLEPDNQRRQFYGKAGACRFKDYGVEYRSPSNYWLSSTSLTQFTFTQVQKAIEMCNDLEFEIDFYYFEVMEAINDNNKVKSQEIIDKFNLIPGELLKIN
tara:strand:+ start:6609 stop:7412 length:804 start_codon:yes stop_codon:yes gene_type:complete